MHIRTQHFLFIIILVAFQSCSCCHRDTVITDSIEVGYPVIPDSIPSMLLERYCYTVSYNGRTRQPNWVMWQLEGGYVE